jgi:polyisoprenoid-binding protein YceI
MWLWELLGGLAIATVVVGLGYLVRAHHSAAHELRAATRRPTTWLVGVPAMLLVLLVGAPFLYVRSVATTPPKPLSFADLAMAPATGAPGGDAAPSAAATTTSVAAAAVAASRSASAHAAATRGAAVALPSVDGSWVVGHGSQARYHIDDTVMGQTSEVVGSTPDVSGTMKVAGSAVTAARVVVNMQTVTCNCVHDDKYHQMLETDMYPTSTFDLTHPILLAAIPAEGQVITVPVTGNFTIHGVSREVTFNLAALRQAGRIAINGKIPVQLEDYNIKSPSNPVGSLSNCVIEFLVAFDRTG